MTASTSVTAAGARTRRSVRTLTMVLVMVAGWVVVLPDLFVNLDQRSPFAQLVAFRPQLLAGGVLLAVALLLSSRLAALARPAAGGLAVVLLVGVALVTPRVVAEPTPVLGRPLTVLAFNALEGGADIDALAMLIRERRPDVVALSEAGANFRSRLSPLVEPWGYRLYGSTGPETEEILGVTVLVAGNLGPVRTRIGDDTAIRSIEITGGGLGALRFVAFHSMAPLPGLVRQWAEDLGRIAQWCGGGSPAVVAGDLNATLDQSALRTGMAGCVDAADQRGDGLIPTWGPTELARLVGPQIDHILASDGIAADSFDVVDIPGSDHRAVVSRLRLAPRPVG